MEPCSGLPAAELFVKRLYMMITESAFGGNGSACCHAPGQGLRTEFGTLLSCSCTKEPVSFLFLAFS